jgi:hypothetical protein
MSRPPRIANWLPWEKPTIYLITFCIESRKPVLANAQAWDICRAVFEKPISGQFCRRLRCQITCIFSQRQRAGMRASATSQNGLSAGLTKRIALRIGGHLYRRARRTIGDGRKVVSMACCDLMNPSRKNGNTSAKILCALVWSSMQRTGHTTLNSTPNEFGF